MSLCTRAATPVFGDPLSAGAYAAFPAAPDSLASIAPRARERLARCKSERAAKGTRELARRAETRRQRDLDHGERCLAQQMPGAIQAQDEIVLMDAVADMAPKRAFELSERNAREAGKLLRATMAPRCFPPWP